MKKIVTSSSVVLLLLSACSEQKKLDEMHDATLKMEKTTEQMNENTIQMKQNTVQMKETTVQMKEKTESLEKLTRDVKDMSEELYDALRQGNSLQLRREAYKSMLEAPTLFKKIAEAGEYFMSFEIQLWNQYGQDKDFQAREILKQQAAEEFFLVIEELAPRDGSVDPTQQADTLNINSDANRSASFNAMAAAMHKVNRKQHRSLKAVPSEKEVSMYTIMEEALLLPRDQAQPKGAAREVLVHEEKAIQLLQARYNIFQMIFIDAVSNIGGKSIVEKAKMALMGWEFNPESLSITKIKYLNTEVLNHALAAKNLLLKLGKKPILNDSLAGLLKHMNVKVNGQGGPDLVAEQTQMMDLLKQLQQ
ncbi:MAG: hypothetical protein ACXVCY_19100 [Pseudobdellovibrionaceae bacterium]